MSKVFKSNTVKCLLHDVARILSLFVRLSVRPSVRPLVGVYFFRYYFKHYKQTLNVWTVNGKQKHNVKLYIR